MVDSAQGFFQATVYLELPIQIVVVFLAMPERLIKLAMHGLGVQAPEVIADQVLRDTTHPRAERGIAAETLSVAPGFQIRQLQKIICILRVEYALVNEAPKFFCWSSVR